FDEDWCAVGWNTEHQRFEATDETQRQLARHKRFPLLVDEEVVECATDDDCPPGATCRVFGGTFVAGLLCAGTVETYVADGRQSEWDTLSARARSFYDLNFDPQDTTTEAAIGPDPAHTPPALCRLD